MRRLALAAALFLAAGCAAPRTLPSSSNALARPLEFSLPTFADGSKHSITGDRGQVVVLDIWATWCEPCRDALPTWEQLANQYGARGLRVYAISVDQDPNQVRQFLDETKISLPVLMDTDAEVAESILKVKAMPTTFFLDRRGTVRFVHEGFAEDHLQQYQSELEELLNENP